MRTFLLFCWFHSVMVRWFAQIQNLNHIIESLQSDLRNKEDDSFLKIKMLSDENARLRYC